MGIISDNNNQSIHLYIYYLKYFSNFLLFNTTIDKTVYT